MRLGRFRRRRSIKKHHRQTLHGLLLPLAHHRLVNAMLVANCTVVSSLRSASRETFALKSAEYRFRLPVIQIHPSQGQTDL
jgi:hypothetical protein